MIYNGVFLNRIPGIVISSGFLNLRIMRSQNWWFGDPRTLRKTGSNLSILEDPMILKAKSLHPGRLKWNIIIEVGKIIFLSKWVIWMFHVNLPGCNEFRWFFLSSSRPILENRWDPNGLELKVSERIAVDEQKSPYCWCDRNPVITSWYGKIYKYPIYRVSYMLGGAGFLLSRVWNHHLGRS